MTIKTTFVLQEGDKLCPTDSEAMQAIKAGLATGQIIYTLWSDEPIDSARSQPASNRFHALRDALAEQLDEPYHKMKWALKYQCSPASCHIEYGYEYAGEMPEEHGELVDLHWLEPSVYYKPGYWVWLRSEAAMTKAEHAHLMEHTEMVLREAGVEVQE